MMRSQNPFCSFHLRAGRMASLSPFSCSCTQPCPSGPCHPVWERRGASEHCLVLGYGGTWVPVCLSDTTHATFQRSSRTGERGGVWTRLSQEGIPQTPLSSFWKLFSPSPATRSCFSVAKANPTHRLGSWTLPSCREMTAQACVRVLLKSQIKLGEDRANLSFLPFFPSVSLPLVCG